VQTPISPRFSNDETRSATASQSSRTSLSQEQKERERDNSTLSDIIVDQSATWHSPPISPSASRSASVAAHSPVESGQDNTILSEEQLPEDSHSFNSTRLSSHSNSLPQEIVAGLSEEQASPPSSSSRATKIGVSLFPVGMNNELNSKLRRMSANAGTSTESLLKRQQAGQTAANNSPGGNGEIGGKVDNKRQEPSTPPKLKAGPPPLPSSPPTTSQPDPDTPPIKKLPPGAKKLAGSPGPSSGLTSGVTGGATELNSKLAKRNADDNNTNNKAASTRIASKSVSSNEISASSVQSCKQCGCSTFQANAFKKGCNVCFHEH